MLQYKIPQNVGIEDKIVGPLSLRQLIIIAVGGGTSYVLFAILNKVYELNILEYIVIAIPAIVSVAAAMIKINDVSFTKFVLLALEFAIKPKKRAWDHRGIAPLVAPDLSDLNPQKKQAIQGGEEKKAVNLDELSRILDSGGLTDIKATGSEDMDKAGDEDLITQAFFGKKKNETDNMYWRANKYGTAKKRLDILAKLPHTERKKEEAKKARPEQSRREEPVKKPIEPQKSSTPQAAVPPPPASPPKKIEAPAPVPVPSSKVQQSQKPAQPPKPAQVIKTDNRNRPRQKPTQKGLPPIPQRQNTQVNTIQKNKPVQFVPQPKKAPEPPKYTPNKIEEKAVPPPTPRKPTQTSPSAGEIKLEELKKGEIEINLD